MDGLIICNTTIARPDELRSANKVETGGLSGVPLRERSLEMTRTARLALGAEIPIIGVGGIFTGEDAWNTIRAGASLIQVYTGLVYEGPGIVRRINRELVKHLEAEGLTSIAHAVGTGVEDSSIGE
jgi:dihydroorotate dehydrogenase